MRSRLLDLAEKGALCGPLPFDAAGAELAGVEAQAPHIATLDIALDGLKPARDLDRTARGATVTRQQVTVVTRLDRLSRPIVTAFGAPALARAAAVAAIIELFGRLKSFSVTLKFDPHSLRSASRRAGLNPKTSSLPGAWRLEVG
jgi:hypothetical protein